MNSFRDSRFLLSTFIAALLVFAGTGASQADQVWVANGTDSMGNPVVVDIDVALTFVPPDDVAGYNEFQFTITNLSPPMSEATHDIVVETNDPLNSATITGTGVMSDWTSVLTYYPNSVTLTSQGTADTIVPGAEGVFFIDTPDLSLGLEGIRVSSEGGGPEIVANLVPEPPSMVLATFGAIGFLGYSLRRRMAKSINGKS